MTSSVMSSSSYGSGGGVGGSGGGIHHHHQFGYPPYTSPAPATTAQVLYSFVNFNLVLLI